MKSTVFIKPIEGDLTDCVRECFEQFGGVESICKGNVFIKFNGTAPHNNKIITDPEVILATVKVVKEVVDPKNIYVMENSAVSTFSRLVFEIDNLSKRIKKLGAKPLYLDEQKSIKIDFNGKALDKPIPIPKILYENLIANKDENTYINIPKLKSHIQCGVTICIKNQHGLLYDEEKIYNHHLIDEKLMDIMSIFKPDFNIVDATHVINFGPSKFNDEFVLPMGLLVSGIDPVAVDTVGSKLIGIENVKHIEMAAERNFGTNNLEEIDIIPSKDLIDRYKIILDHEISNIPVKPKSNTVLVKGTKQACKTGCLCFEPVVAWISRDYNSKNNPFVGVYGKGQDTKILDKYHGPFVINGPCAVSELKDYFENRKKKEKLKVYYIDEHTDLAKMGTYIRKAMKIKLTDLADLSPCSISRNLFLQISAKLHGGKFLLMK